jgi:hypothetical protein
MNYHGNNSKRIHAAYAGNTHKYKHSYKSYTG